MQMRINYSEYMPNDEIGYEYRQDLSLPENIRLLLDNSVVLPQHNLQAPIFVTYSLLPSAVCKIVPILYCFGEKGSGKTQLLIIASALHKAEINNPGKTFAALRNEFNKTRWWDPETLQSEKNTCFIYDNVNAKTFQDEKLYNLFLVGYSRKTDAMGISDSNGGILYFRVFSPKIISSVHAHFADPGLSELSRRVLPLHTKQWERMLPEEKVDISLEDIRDKIDLESTNLSFLRTQFLEFWNHDRLIEFATNRAKFSPGKCKGQIPDNLDSHKITLLRDFLATGLTCGIWNSRKEAFEHISKFYDYSNRIISTNSTLVKVLEIFLKQKEYEFNRERELGIEDENTIDPEAINRRVRDAASKGWLDDYVKPNSITQAMDSLGWKKAERNGDIVYVRK
jgi:hypothetical protein